VYGFAFQGYPPVSASAVKRKIGVNNKQT